MVQKNSSNSSAQNIIMELKATLEKSGWKLETDALSSGFLRINKGDLSYMLNLFFSDEKSGAYLADEKPFKDGDPLWFTSSSNVVSPIFKLSEHVEQYNQRLEAEGKSQAPLKKIVVLMPCTYIINADEEYSKWGSTGVISYDFFVELINSDQPLQFENSAKYVSKPSRSKTSEFDEWQKSEKDSEDSPKTESPKTESEEENKESNVSLKNVKFGVVVNDSKSAEDMKLSETTMFRMPENGGMLGVEFEVEGHPQKSTFYKYILQTESGTEIAKDGGYLYETNRQTVYMDITSMCNEDVWFIVKEDKECIYKQKITFVNIEKDYTKYLNIDGFGLYRIGINDDKDDFDAITNGDKQECFCYDNLAGILIGTVATNICETPLTYHFTIYVENEEGQRVFESRLQGTLNPSEEYALIANAIGTVCPTGNYTACVEFYDTDILAFDFSVGQSDIEATFDLEDIKLPASGAKRSTVKKSKDPMAELQSMIGLEGVKKQIKTSLAKIKLDKLRQEQGLPIKSQQLHMAFLGNPGTGKTTIAKLLGRIYKNIGVLSKGHVVVRDRTTLLNQNWGSEGELVAQAVKEAKGGILFIDEAYDLVTEHKSDPGKLIISALLSAMADEKERDLMVIFAGYTMPMERLFNKNQGLISRLTRMHFEDYTAAEMMQIADFWLGKNCYSLSPDARKHLEGILTTAYMSRDENFGNARYVYNLLENEIQPAMAERIMSEDLLDSSMSQLTTIEACDIPNYNAEQEGAMEAIAKLDNMVGLNSLKSQIRSHLSYIRFVQARRDHKISTSIPPLHMVFTGNPGTGKTSVAEYLGDIYRSLGILSVGNVIKVTRADMIDNIVGGTEEKMKNLLAAARGSILFIDEAYTLFEKHGVDFGKNAVEVLLDALGKENSDMIVILAGYPKEMEDLLSMNPGLKGRFPYTFNFEDYDEEELFEIAESVVKRNNLTLNEEAAQALKAVIRRECKIKDSNFSNARFVVRLITTQVLPNMATRLEGETDLSKLSEIQQQDIPIELREVKLINENLFDEEAIEAALERLDSMVGLTKVKAGIHQFVEFARNLNLKDPAQIDRYPLKWSFVGNTGTGKSSVAEILSAILKAMHLLGKGHTVEVQAEELYGVATYKADELIQQRMRESLQGLLFVDGDAPQFRAANSNFNPDYLRMCLAVNTNEIHGKFAVVIAEHESPRIALAKSLNQIGISNFDHTLIFEDYTTEELMAILAQQLGQYEMHLSEEASSIMRNYIMNLGRNAHETNARTMSELATALYNIASTSGEVDKEIPAKVVANFETTPKTPKRKIGY